MKSNKALLIRLVALLSLMSQTVSAGGVAEHSVQTSTHSAQAVSHGVIGAVKVTSGVVAVPLAVAGSAGKVSGQAGKELWDIANAPIGTPLPITEKTLTVGPTPSDAVAKGDNEDE